MAKLDLSFIKTWKSLTQIEEKAIISLKLGLKIIFDNIPKKNIVAIYLKGSFLRREMNNKSDVDVSIIVNDNKFLETLQKLQLRYSKTMKPNFEFTGYSIEELKTGKLSPLGKKTRTGTARFVRLVPTLKLIYGGHLDLKSFYTKKDLELLKSLIKTFNNVFLPNYEKKEISFQGLLKQTLWLFELETSIKKEKFKFKSWKKLLEHYDQKDLIYEVLILRESNIKNQKTQDQFILKLKRYLKDLSDKYI
tara:strand:- start:1066 stop:1812 length:747 start_codon:yes stop_codon:yes gene_type:complete